MDKHGQKTGGRKAGTPNAITKEIRPVLVDIVKGQLEPDKLKALLDRMSAKATLDFVTKLLPFILPKMEQIEINQQMTPELAREMLNALIAEEGEEGGEDER